MSSENISRTILTENDRVLVENDVPILMVEFIKILDELSVLTYPIIKIDDTFYIIRKNILYLTVSEDALLMHGDDDEYYKNNIFKDVYVKYVGDEVYVYLADENFALFKSEIHSNELNDDDILTIFNNKDIDYNKYCCEYIDLCNQKIIVSKNIFIKIDDEYNFEQFSLEYIHIDKLY